ncbi:MAG: PQQ-like beta-propeller repeat protein [Verrucomicrobia bacterium]|jgi:outer membrane protein assembly factor BamB|nr:PQQ-like beta-propeller repeat protein [Verrucomicrobiota bacterium]OQC66376.1 MAG: outer membrane biogenesis protein BamB [Verrucomicrobia bacterium ADurb.Bin006]MDI9379323.1 PQQ-like beta-propeller repeat protein [Verrucomicrobiota bacterium]HNU98776.1 PQQ-like beta-propeller repeat protein [Verrucomicrobiota bacterium]HOA61894.1 PQQ-like beta-propeller repeat protein [Verrucomicrobiota bacterium]
MKRTNRLSNGAQTTLLLLLELLLAPGIHAVDWPQWFGSDRTGRSAETGLLKTWPADGPRLSWKTAGLGSGFTTVSVAQGRIFTAGDMADGNYIIALKESDGTKLWTSRLGKAGAPGWGGFAGPRCTPTVDGDRLFAVGQYGELACFETATGKELWRKHLVTDFGGSLPEWGFSESPLLDGNKIAVTPGGAQGAIAALDKKTGAPLWQSKEFTDAAQYASLVPATIGGVRQYIQLTMESVAGVAANDGKLLWRAPRKGRVAVIPTPIVKDDLVYVTSGYEVGCNLFKIVRDSATFDATRVYANKTMANHHGGAILVGDYVYGHSDRGGWTCQNLASGETAWQEKAKLDKGSLTYADGRFYCREEKQGSSEVALLEATPVAYVEKGRFKQPDQSGKQAWPHPVIANGKLYLRDQDLLFCYDVKAQ